MPGALAKSKIIMEYTFTFTEQEATLVINAIQELPAKLANPLTQKIQEQARQQASSAEEAVEQE